MLRKLVLIMAALGLSIPAMAQLSPEGLPIKVITDADIGTFNHWSSDTVYNLQGFVFVEDGEVLEIEPGTIIKGNEGTGANATALIVARGGKIHAEGTPTSPIIFTSIIDDVTNPLDIPLTDARAKWGGVIILGRARINTGTGVGQIEGIPDTEPRGAYGGTDDNDSSGVIKYVSVRHGGSEIGAGNEINGWTFGAVGRRTVISHLEAFYNLDDGYEWFGGTVNCDHLVSAFCGDDEFDYDEGFRGSVQFAFGIHAEDAGDRGGEHDGGTTPVDGSPYATPLFVNVTYLGRGAASATSRCFEIRDNAGTGYYNSIFSQFGTYGVRIENNDAEPTDSRDRLLAGHIKFFNNLWWDFGNGNTATDITNGDTFAEDSIFANGNDGITDPSLAGITRIPDSTLDPRPTDLTAWMALHGGWVDPLGVDGYNPTGPNIDVSWPAFQQVDYPGAFDPNAPIDSSWVSSWTALDQYGFLAVGGGGSCCVGSTGNVNNDPGDVTDIADLTFLIDHLFISFTPLACAPEGNINGDAGGVVDIADLTALIDHLFISFAPTAPCQ